ncbi:MAG TPA: MarR family transcriptional regulator [Nocardioidaceae bacterium]|nr:MarR family transcriptional regulator [Nocardioidaceae bacterium]
MGAPPTAPDGEDRGHDDDATAVLAGTQVIGSLIAESISQVEQEVTMPQLRVLMLAATQAPLNLLTVAADLGVHPSNATRTCDRLVRAGLLDRRTSERDRRHLAMTLTPAGHRLVDQVLGHRRRQVERALDKMSPEDRAALVRSLAALAEAAEADTGQLSEG